jgi:hypothetical protein
VRGFPRFLFDDDLAIDMTMTLSKYLMEKTNKQKTY